MFNLRFLRLGNSLLLGLIGFLAGVPLLLSHSAQPDIYGSDCPPNWSNLSAACPAGSSAQPYDTGMTSCATSPTGDCCTYEGYKAICNDPGSTQIGYAYVLKGKGATGYTYICSPQYGCEMYG